MKNEFYIEGNIVKIVLNSKKHGNMIAYIDIVDLDKMHKFNGKWYVWHRENEGFYAKGNVILDDGRRTTIFMHRYIIGELNSSIKIDHKDFNGLNNTRDNLVKATNQQNSQNRNGAYSNSSTEIRGVSYNNRLKKYEAYINVNYKKYSIGYFENKFEASEMVSIARAITMPYSHKDVAEKNFYSEINYPALYFRFGEMGGGKTEGLIKSAHVHVRMKKDVCVLTPSLNTRDGYGVVSSRSGKTMKATTVDLSTNIFELIKDINPDIVFIDEINFLSTQQIEQLSDIVDVLNISVIGYGLRTDFKGSMFESSKKLFEISDIIQYVHRQCSEDDCDNTAIFNMRISDGIPVFNGNQIEVGGDESYMPVCRRHYNRLKRQYT